MYQKNLFKYFSGKSGMLKRYRIVPLKVGSTIFMRLNSSKMIFTSSISKLILGNRLVLSSCFSWLSEPVLENILNSVNTLVQNHL